MISTPITVWTQQNKENKTDISYLPPDACRHFTASVRSPHHAAQPRHAVKTRWLQSFPDHNSCVHNNQYLNNPRTKNVKNPAVWQS